MKKTTRHMTPVLLMRKRNLMGPNFAKHSGIKPLSKSVGDAVEKGIITP